MGTFSRFIGQFSQVSGFLDVLKSLNNDIGKEKTQPIMKISRLFIECRTSDHANYWPKPIHRGYLLC